MNNSKKSKILLYIMTLICLILSFLVFANLDPEEWIKKEGEPVFLADIPKGDKGAYTGKIAGDDIKKITGSKELEEIRDTEYVTAIPKEVIKTGVYGLQPWVSPYGLKRRGRAADATNSYILSVLGYSEYYLIKLPDDTYILAQFGNKYRKAIEKGENVTLPLGIRKSTGYEASSYLKGICDKYGANHTKVLYAIDNEWNEKYELISLIIRIGISVVVFFILAFAFITVGDKIKHQD